MELVPLRVTIGLKTEKKKRLHAFPPFNEIPETIRDGMDWSHYVDQFGGWHYDNVSGHDNDDATNGSPRGVWIGLLLVPEDFATEAVMRFPAQCQIVNETQAERFYEDRVTVDQPEVLEDVEVLQAIAAKRQAGIPESDDDRAALDADSPRRGRKRNKTKKWDDMLTNKGLAIIEKHRKSSP
jgi:hypothetical protein